MFTLKDTGETMSYDQVRQYLMENPDIWMGAKEGKEVAMPKEEKPSAMPGNTNADIANRIRNKKQKGALSAIDFGISVTIYNGALDFMASQVDKGTKLGNAIANTIKWIDEKMAGAKWNKGAFGKYMNDTYSVTLPNGRQVEVVRDDSKETAEVINGWYSELEQKILDSKEDKLPAATWAKRLKSKEDEDVWTGVRDFLESKKPSEQVSKKELRDWMKDNRVEISEVVKSKKWEAITDVRASERFTDVWDIYKKDEPFSSGSIETVVAKSQEEAIQKYLENPKYEDKTKFSEYQLEGDKENYKEVLVTIPDQSKFYIDEEMGSAYRFREGKFEYTPLMEDGSVSGEWVEVDERAFDTIEDYLEIKQKALKNVVPAKFYSSHWSEPNILVHLRMNTRTDANGNKVLFLEEVQSDWGQKGKKNGFAPIGDFDTSKIKTVKVDERFGKTEVYYDGKNIGTIFPKSDKEVMNQATQVARSYYDNQTAIKTPSAPFVTDTNSWTKLGLKVALREAVKQGADKIAWSTGTQQFDRWGTEKIDWVKSGKGWKISIQEQFSGTAFEGMNIDNEALSESGTTITSKEDLKNAIDRILSREKTESERQKLTDRVWNRMQAEDRGTSLPRKEGMESFYGVPSEGNLGIVGNVAKSLFKQEPGTVNIEISDSKVDLDTPPSISKSGDGRIGVSSPFEGEGKVFDAEQKQEALAYLKEQKLKYDAEIAKRKTSTQYSIDITPEMRESVEKGLPLFGTKLSEKQDPVITALDKGKIKGGLGMNAGIWNAAIDIIKGAYIAGKTVAQAIEEGIAYLKSKGEDIAKYQEKIDEIRKEVAMPISNALKDVESTAKALEGKDIIDLMPFFAIKGQKRFFHASPQKRKGRLKKSTAQQFGTGIYFSTNKDLVTDEFGENITEVALDLKNPVFTSTKKWYKLVDLALEKANEGKPVDEDGNIIGEETDYYEIKPKFISDAATEMGFDAIIDEESSQYDNEIVILQEDRIIYEEDLPKYVSEAYHADKKAGKETELTKAVEDLLGGKEAVPLVSLLKYAEPIFVEGEGWAVKTLPHKYSPLAKVGVKTYPTKELAQIQANKESMAISNKIAAKEEEDLLRGKEADRVEKFLKDLYWKEGGLAMNAGLWNAAVTTILKAYQAGKTVYEAIQAGIDYLKKEGEDIKEWQKYIDSATEQLKRDAEKAGREIGTRPTKKPKAEKPSVTPPPTEEEEEVLEAPEGQVPKKVVGRRYKADTPEMQKALEEIGLFRTPGSIKEAQKKANQLVGRMGIDAALEVARNESIDGLYKIGIMGAVLEDIEARRANTNDIEEFVRLTNEAARVTNETSNYLTTAGQELRMWQEILQNKDLPFEYEARKKAFVEQFGQEAFTKEIEERFESLNTQYQEALAKINELEQQKANWERQSLIDDIAEEGKKETPASKKSFFKEAASRVRKLLLSKPGIFSAATPASLAWDASVEAVALALEGLGTLEVAIGKGLEKLRSTNWYRGLASNKKSEAEKSFKEEIEKAYIPQATIDDNGKVVIPQGTLKAYVEAGYRDAEAIVDSIYNQLITDNPNITKRDVRDAVSGYGRKYNPTPNQVRDQINEIKAINKLISAIEDAENGIEKTTNPKTQKQISDRLKSLQQQYEAAYQNSFGRKPSQPSETTRYATVKRNMEKEIERLRAMKPRPERRPPIDYDAQMEALATEKFRLQEEWDAEFSKQDWKSKKLWEQIGDIAYSITQLPKSLLAGGFDLGMLLIQGSMLSVSDLATTKQAAKILAKSLISEKEYQKEIGKIRNSELYRIIRKSGLDLTIPFGKALLAEETGVDTLAESLFNLLIAPLKKIPNVGPQAYEFAKRFNFIRALNRAQTAYMNTLRVGNFLIDVQNMEAKGITFYNNPEAYKDVADAINTLSGRGGLFGAENSKTVIRGLNIAFFSPKNWSSILRLYTPIGLAIELGTKRAGADPYKMSVAQARIIKTFAKFVAGTSLGILGVAALSNDEGDEDEEKKKETGNVTVDLKNPQSSAFGKIRVGNQIFDPWGGKMQIITLQARLLIHYFGKYAYKDPYTGIEKKLEDSYFKTPGGLVGEYVKGKFAPSLRVPWQLANSIPVKGRPGYFRPVEGGKEFYLFEPFQESYENLTIKALQETYGNQPLSVAEIATLMIIAGGGVTTLNDQEDITTVVQIRNLLSPGEDEVKKFKKAFSIYLKEGDFGMAEKVFDRATGSYQLQQTIQEQQEEGKAVGDVQRQLSRKRKQAVSDLFENIREDNLIQKYAFEKKYRDEMIEAVYNDEMLSTSGLSAKKQEMFERINALTPEMKEDIKRNYDLQYDELMIVAKGLDKVAERADGYYEKKAKRTPWVRQYLRLTGKEENQ
jgi:hypothetical protein